MLSQYFSARVPPDAKGVKYSNDIVIVFEQYLTAKLFEIVKKKEEILDNLKKLRICLQHWEGGHFDQKEGSI